jgi:hypothetical protein
LASWNIDAAVILPSFGETQAPTGGHMLKLTTGEGLTETDSEVHFQTCLEPGEYGVIVDWKFYSEEFKEWCNSNFQDSMTIWLETADGEVPVAAMTIKDLCPPSECADCGGQYVGLEESDVSLDQGGVFNTPWAISTAGFSVAGEGSTVTLHVEFSDAGDAIYDSVVLIDRIQFVPCPAFCAQFDCGAEPVCDCGACPADVQCNQGTCCVPDCDGKNCGDDGCGGECGACAGECVDGVCCVPNCFLKECGDDGCGGVCGLCIGLEDTCAAGQCVCVPDCVDKDCGSDGCGGNCGTCDDGLACSHEVCGQDGQCVVDTSDCCTGNDECDDAIECTIDTCVVGTCHSVVDPDCCDPSTFFESFEEGAVPGWDLDESVGGVGWNVWTPEGGDGVLYYGDPETHTFDNGETNSGSATAPLMELLPDTGYTLSFDVFFEGETGAAFDKLTVAVEVDDGGYLTLWDKSDYGQMATWESVSLDISPLAGHAISFRFSFDSGDNWNNAFLGALVDDVEVTSLCAPVECADDDDCTSDVPGATGTCVEGTCQFVMPATCDQAADCNDTDICTADSCTVAGYCLNVVQESCCYEDADCQDNDPCTTDVCQPPVWFGYPACVNMEIAGCCTDDSDCDDGNGCTIDSCPGAGEQCASAQVPNCCLGPADCADDDLCTMDVCTDNLCGHVDICCTENEDCNDDSECTDDACMDGICNFVPNMGDGCCTTPLFRDDFSTDKGWEYGTDWEWGEAHPSPDVGTFEPDPGLDHTSANDNKLAGVRIGANTDKTLHEAYYLTSPEVDISGATSPQFSFWRFLNSDYPPYMTNVVEAYDGNGWVTLWTKVGTGFITDTVWTLQSFDVTAYKNASFKVRIGVSVGNAGVYACPSWSVDDVQIIDVDKLGMHPLCCDQDSECQGAIPEVDVCTAGACL